jgi:hypothetical protein
MAPLVTPISDEPRVLLKAMTQQIDPNPKEDPIHVNKVSFDVVQAKFSSMCPLFQSQRHQTQTQQSDSAASDADQRCDCFAGSLGTNSSHRGDVRRSKLLNATDRE